MNKTIKKDAGIFYKNIKKYNSSKRNNFDMDEKSPGHSRKDKMVFYNYLNFSRIAISYEIA